MSDRIDELVATVRGGYPWQEYPSKSESHVALTELAAIAREAEVQRKRGDFFRNALDAIGLCPTVDDYPCKDGGVCLFLNGGFPNYSACWDEVARSQR